MSASIKGLVIRQIAADDIPVIAHTLNSMYAFKRPESFYYWLLLNNPNRLHAACAVIKGKVAGISAIQSRYLTNGLTGGQAIALNVFPEFGGKGVFSALINALVEVATEHDFLFVFANARAKQAMQGSLRFQFIGEVFYHERLNMKDSVSTLPYSVLEIDEKTAFPHFQEKVKDEFSFSFDELFYRWRYALCPVYRYQMLTFLDAFVVYKVFVDPKSGERIGDIIEFQCPGDDPEKLRSLLSNACFELSRQRVSRITVWLTPEQIYRRTVASLGFRKTVAATHFGIRHLSDRVTMLNDFSHWHLHEKDATNY